MAETFVVTLIHMYFQGRSSTVDLSTDTTLLVDISDALSERDKVKFTVHTKVMPCVDFVAVTRPVSCACMFYKAPYVIMSRTLKYSKLWVIRNRDYRLIFVQIKLFRF